MTDLHSEVVAGVDGAAFARRFLAHAGSQLPGRPMHVLVRLAQDFLRAGTHRRAEDTFVRVQDLDDETTAIDIVSLDAPFLLDSVRLALGRAGHDVHRVLAPQIVVDRNDSGDLVHIHDIDDAADVPAGAIVESWMHLEIDHVPTDDEHERIRADVTNVLTDVHNAVADRPKMIALFRRLADALIDDPGQFDRETSEEAGALLR